MHLGPSITNHYELPFPAELGIGHEELAGFSGLIELETLIAKAKVTGSVDEKVGLWFTIFQSVLLAPEVNADRMLEPKAVTYLSSVLDACAAGLVQYVKRANADIRKSLQSKQYEPIQALDEVIVGMRTYLNAVLEAGYSEHDGEEIESLRRELAGNMMDFLHLGFEYFRDRLNQRHSRDYENAVDARISEFLGHLKDLEIFMLEKGQMRKRLQRAATSFINIICDDYYSLVDNLEETYLTGDAMYTAKRLIMLADDMLGIIPFAKRPKGLAEMGYDLVMSMANLADYMVADPASYEDGIGMYEEAAKLYRDFFWRFQPNGILFSDTVEQDSADLMDRLISSAALRGSYDRTDREVRSVHTYIEWKRDILHFSDPRDTITETLADARRAGLTRRPHPSDVLHLTMQSYHAREPNQPKKRYI